jgi:hypothetical protein
MFLLTLIILGVAMVSARLVTDIRNDRPLTPPRSQAEELDRQSARLPIVN